MNGDGFADLVVGAPASASNAGAAYVYLGGPGGLAATPTTLDPPDFGSFGGSVASAGDVNGDGFADIVVGASAVSGGIGAAYLYLGGATGVSITPREFAAPAGSGAFGFSVASVGDIDGDGYSEVVVGAWASAGWDGAVHVYFGGPSGAAATPLTLDRAAGSGGQFGISVAGAGDVNGDGYADMAVGAAREVGNDGAVYVFLGGAGGLSTSPVRIPGPAGRAGQFAAVASAGDLNGDGFADLAVGAPEESARDGAAYVYLGGAGGLATTGSRFPGPSAAAGFFGFPVHGAGDIDGDGFADLVVGARRAGASGAVFVYRGAPSGPSLPPARIDGPAGGSGFGGALASVGEPNVRAWPRELGLVTWRLGRGSWAATYAGADQRTITNTRVVRITRQATAMRAQPFWKEPLS